MKLKDYIKTTKPSSKPKTTGFILWRGASPVDGSSIVAIATINTDNPKTGNMLQTWILSEEIAPHEAVKTGSDSAICGDCSFKSGNGCYVAPHQAPLVVWRSYKAGKYPQASSLQLVGAGRYVRLGAYGDPAMVPYMIWQQLLSNSLGHTGYTHQWAQPWFDSRLLAHCMASAETQAQAKELTELGYRYFLAMPETEEVPNTAIPCPNYTHGLTCDDCRLCNGGTTGKSIVVPIHGVKAKKVENIYWNI